MSNSDGEVRIKINFDTSNAAKEVAGLEKEVSKLEKKQMPLIGQFEQLQGKIAETKRQIAETKEALSSGKIDKVDAFMNTEQGEKGLKCLTSEAEELLKKIEALDNQILPLKEKLESLKFTGSSDSSLTESVQAARQGLERTSESAEKIKGNFSEVFSSLKENACASFDSVEKKAGSFSKRIGNTIKSAFVFSVLYKGLSQLKEQLSGALQTNTQFSNSLAIVKGNLATAFQPILQTAMPIINAFMQKIIQITAYIAAFVNILTGKSVSASAAAAKAMQESINASKSGAGGATAAEKELTAAIKEKQKQVKALQRENKAMTREYEQEKKAVEAQTDELEKQITALEKQKDNLQELEKAHNKSAAAQREAIQSNIETLQKQQSALSKQQGEIRKQQEAEQKQVDAQKAAIDSQVKALQKRIKALQKEKKASEDAKKANQKFTASFDELSTLGSVEEADPYDTEIEQLQEQIEELNERKELIEDIDYSERLEALDAENEKIQEQIDKLNEQKDAIKDVDYSAALQGYDDRISAVREQIDALNESVKENPLIEQNEELIEKLQEEIELLQEQKNELTATAGAASNLGMQFSDVLEDVENKLRQSSLGQWLDKNKEKILAAVPAVAAALGAFTLFKNFLGLNFISPKGCLALAGVALAGFLAWFGDPDKTIEGLKKLLSGFNKFLEGDFKGGISEIWDGITDLTEAFVAGLNNLIDKLIQRIGYLVDQIKNGPLKEALESTPSTPKSSHPNGGWNEFPSSVPDRWSTYSTREAINIPALAQGRVLPPNKPFLAWVGDQKEGTNVETPLSTIEDAVRNVLAERGDSNFVVNANGSLGALIRLLRLEISKESKRSTAF